MVIIKIKNDNEQAKALISYIKTLPYVEVEEDNNEGSFRAENEYINTQEGLENKKKLERFDLAEIADELEAGLCCYVHKATGKVECIPENIDDFDDPDGLWQELLDKVENDIDNYIIISPPESRQFFEIMESFIEKVAQPKLRQQLDDALQNRKPFRNFNDIVHSSGTRQEWFEHKSLKIREFVREELLNALDEE